MVVNIPFKDVSHPLKRKVIPGISIHARVSEQTWLDSTGLRFQFTIALCEHSAISGAACYPRFQFTLA